MDSQALQRYAFMRRLGLFGVEPDSFAGAAAFLRVGRRLLAESETLLCIMPERRRETSVSILIPARNEEQHIGVALHRALDSTGVLLEVVVLDDHSTDGTAAIVRQFATWDRRVRLETARMKRSSAPSYAAACGQWVIARRSAYLQAGGHGAQPASRHDGISLPRSFREHGFQTDLFDATALASTRMYQDLNYVWQGFGKSAREGIATPYSYALGAF